MTNRNLFRSERLVRRVGMRSLIRIATVLSLIQLGLLHGQQSSYTFTKLATLGENATLTAPPPAPTFHINDFEPGGLNNKGDVVYGTDLGTSADPSTTFGEGVFLRPHGGATELDLGRATLPAAEHSTSCCRAGLR